MHIVYNQRWVSVWVSVWETVWVSVLCDNPGLQCVILHLSFQRLQMNSKVNNLSWINEVAFIEKLYCDIVAVLESYSSLYIK